MTHVIKCFRESYTAQTTIGKIYINECYFSFSLEDTVRAFGIKVKHETAIPGGTEAKPQKYKVKITYSPRFKRETVQLYTDEKTLILKAQGIEFSGIRCHGGNRHKNTSGCPLMCKNRVDNNTIQETMEKEFTEAVRELLNTCDVEYWVINLPQSN